MPCRAVPCLDVGRNGGRSLFLRGRGGCFYYLMLRYFHTNFQKSFPWLRPPQGAAQGMHERQNINEISWGGKYPPWIYTLLRLYSTTLLTRVRTCVILLGYSKCYGCSLARTLHTQRSIRDKSRMRLALIYHENREAI